jgi:hypothetical protein
MEPRFLQMTAAVSYSGRSRASLYVALSEKKIIAKKAGKTVLIDRQSLDAYLDTLPEAVYRQKTETKSGRRAETTVAA